MRLRNVENGHTWQKKLKLWFIQFVSRRKNPDVLRLVFYRPELFGQAFSQGLQALLRGPSEWSVAERELFASFVSRQNQCDF